MTITQARTAADLRTVASVVLIPGGKQVHCKHELIEVESINFTLRKQKRIDPHVNYIHKLWYKLNLIL